MSHARLSPSSAHRWMACPGSVRECAKYPDKSGHAAIDGTHTHSLLEHCIKNNADPLNMVGVKLSDHEGEYTVDSDRAERVKFALEYIWKKKVQHNASVTAETRVDAGEWIERNDIQGTCDVIIRY